LGRHAFEKCQKNSNRNQTVLHPQKECRYAVVADIVAVAVVAAARARPEKMIPPKPRPLPNRPRPLNHRQQ
jgi:DNA-binding helix-hairpin-helix protein with protein kinase domain